MYSLQGAPTLGKQPRSQFSYNAYNYDDDVIPTVQSNEEDTGETKRRHRRRSSDKEDVSTEKESKKSRGSSSSSKKKSKSQENHHSSGSESKKKSKSRENQHSSSVEKKKKSKKAAAPSPEPDPVYDDDFEASMDNISDEIPTVTTPVTATSKSPLPAASVSQPPARIESPIRRRSTDMKIQEELIQMERKREEWMAEQAARDQKTLQQQQAIHSQLEDLKKVTLDLLSVKNSLEKPASTPTEAVIERESPPKGADEPSADAPQTEIQRRRRREREQAIQLRRLHDEEAAHSLFQRLAQDVRDVFHELNLSVVAAEKERLLKDERYRKEREAHDKREEAERSEKLRKELKEREEREEKFWSLIEDREEKFQAFLESKLRKDDIEREERLKRDLEDRETRLRNDRELRDQLEHMEKERRVKEEGIIRERDHSFLEAQLQEIKTQYRSHLDELRRQAEMDKAHADEMHKIELEGIMRRGEEAVKGIHANHTRELSSMEAHTANAAKLEKLMEHLQDEMVATRKMNDNLANERADSFRVREQQLEEQKALVGVLIEELKNTKSELEKERARVASLHTKFEISISSFRKSSEEDCLQFKEALSHYETLRQQLEKDRRMMLNEVAQERKLLEQQHDEFLARKMTSMNELQEERMRISKERTEAALIRERQNRDESETIKSLRAREEEYALRIESLEADRAAIAEMKAEHRKLLEESSTERESLRRERQIIEREKTDLLSRFEDLRKRAEDAFNAQESLSKELAAERAKNIEVGYSGAGALKKSSPTYMDPTGDPSLRTESRLHIDIARQRAILKSYN